MIPDKKWTSKKKSVKWPFYGMRLMTPFNMVHLPASGLKSWLMLIPGGRGALQSHSIRSPYRKRWIAYVASGISIKVSCCHADQTVAWIDVKHAPGVSSIVRFVWSDGTPGCTGISRVRDVYRIRGQVVRSGSHAPCYVVHRVAWDLFSTIRSEYCYCWRDCSRCSQWVEVAVVCDISIGVVRK